MKSNQTLLIIGYYQILGGCLGLVFWIWALPNFQTLNGPLFLVSMILVAAQLYAIYSGRALLRKEPKGFLLSTTNQAFQVISFSLSGFTFQYVNGFGVLAGLDITQDTKINLTATLSTMSIAVNKEHELMTLSINLVAIWVIFLLENLQRSIAADAISHDAII